MPRVTGAHATLRLATIAELADWVHAVAWSPDSQRVAATCGDGAIVTLSPGEEVREFQRHDAPATTVSWSTTGRLASGGQDGRVLIDNQPHQVGNGWIGQVTWRPDGGLLAVAHGRHVHILDPAGRQTAVSGELAATVACIEWHPRGVELAAGTYGGVQLLRGSSGHRGRRLRFKGSVLALAISPDGRRLAHGNRDASVHFWDLHRGTELEMSGYETKVRELAWRHDGRLLATGGGNTITVWDFAGRGPAGTRPQQLDHHTAPVSWLGFQPHSGLLASTGQDGTAAIWKLGRDDLPLTAVAIDDRITTAAWSPDGRHLALAGAGGTLAIAELEPEA